MKVFRRPASAPAFNTFFDKNVSTNSVKGSIDGSKVYCIHIEHALGQGYIGRQTKVDRFGIERLGAVCIVGRMHQAFLFDKATADWWSNQLAAQGCKVTISKVKEKAVG